MYEKIYYASSFGRTFIGIMHMDYQIDRCVFLCGIKSVLAHHHQCGRSITSLAEYDIHDARTNYP